MSQTEVMIDYIKRTRFEDLPEEIIHKVKLILLDTIGVGLAGYRTKPCEIVIEVMKNLGGRPESSILGDGTKLNCVQAGFVNAYIVDILDFEDTYQGLGHPNATIIPAALSVGECVNASGKDLIVAILLGNEISIRIGLAIHPSPSRIQQVNSYAWHSFGAATAACRLFNLNRNQIKDAFGFTGSNTPLPTSVHRWERPLHWIKNNFARQTDAGIMGALFAKKGFRGPRTMLDSEYGFWIMAGSDRCDFDRMTNKLGEEYEILKIIFKPYPSCRWTHSAANAVEIMMKEHHLNEDDIKEIKATTPSELIREKGFIDYEPQTLVDAEFSLPFVIAAQALKIEPGLNWFKEETLRNPKLQNISRKVKVESSPEADKIYYSRKGIAITTVEIVTNNGKRFRERVDLIKGVPENPINIEEKFRRITSSIGLKSEHIDNIIEVIDKIEKLEDLSHLMKLLVVPN